MSNNWQTLEKDKEGNILSIKRLIDNVTFNTNDTVTIRNCVGVDNKFVTNYQKIKEFKIEANQMQVYVESGSGYYIDRIQKVAENMIPKNLEVIKAVMSVLDEFKNKNNDLIYGMIALDPLLSYQDAVNLLFFYKIVNMQKEIDDLKSLNLKAN